MKVSFLSTMTQFGGLKVSLANALSDAIDVVSQRRKYASGLIASATRTAAVSYDLTGFKGLAYIGVEINVTAITLGAGSEIYFLFQKQTPSGAYQNIFNHNPSATGSKLFNVDAAGGASMDAITTTGAAYNTVVKGMWGDAMRLHLFHNGVTTFSVTFNAYYWAMA